MRTAKEVAEATEAALFARLFPSIEEEIIAASALGNFSISVYIIHEHASFALDYLRTLGYKVSMRGLLSGKKRLIISWERPEKLEQCHL